MYIHFLKDQNNLSNYHGIVNKLLSRCEMDKLNSMHHRLKMKVGSRISTNLQKGQRKLNKLNHIEDKHNFVDLHSIHLDKHHSIVHHPH